MTLPSFAHGVAPDLGSATEALAEGGAIPYAGATELVPAMRLGLLAPDRLVDIKQIDELQGMRVDGATLTIGALTTHARLASSEMIRSHLPSLTVAAARIGNPRVRSQGTIGGNLAFAEPRSDLLPVLIALDAAVVLASRRGRRRAPLEDLLEGAFAFARDDDELIVEVSIDLDGLTYQRYHRVALSERPAAGIAVVGRSDGWHLVVGAAGYSPVRFTADRPDLFDPEVIAAGIDPIDDATGGADFKRYLVRRLAERSLGEAVEASG